MASNSFENHLLAFILPQGVASMRLEDIWAEDPLRLNHMRSPKKTMEFG